MFRTSILLVVLGVGFVAAPVKALACSDRPGTPTNLTAKPSSPTAIKLQWKNTASESNIHWDIDITSNGRPVRGLTGVSGDFGGGQPFSMKGHIGRIYIRGLEYGPRYCFKVRARTAAGSGGCVSARWSHVECTSTSAPPLGVRR